MFHCSSKGEKTEKCSVVSFPVDLCVRPLKLRISISVLLSIVGIFVDNLFIRPSIKRLIDRFHS